MRDIVLDQIVTEDDTPVDNLPSEKHQRLLTESLFTSWSGPGEGRSFLAAANVGLFEEPYRDPLVPDVFLSLDVRVADDWWEKQHRSYFFWEFGKPPEAVIEIVSNRKGHELDSKLIDYARMGIRYYIVYDPSGQLGIDVLLVYELRGRSYVRRTDRWLPEVGLGLTLWQGVYEAKADTWLRWCDREGNVILTGAERAAQAEAQWKQECQRAEQVEAWREQERQRAEQAEAQRQQEHLRAEQAEAQRQQERQRAEQAEAQRQQERQRAEQAETQREQERQRAEQAEAQREQERQRAERLAAQLRALGIEVE